MACMLTFHSIALLYTKLCLESTNLRQGVYLNWQWSGFPD